MRFFNYDFNGEQRLGTDVEELLKQFNDIEEQHTDFNKVVNFESSWTAIKTVLRKMIEIRGKH